jgi:hypothetical protein
VGAATGATESLRQQRRAVGAVNSSLTSVKRRTRSVAAVGLSAKRSSSSNNVTVLRNISTYFMLRALKARQVDGNLIGREQASDLGNKARQFPGELRVIGGGIDKIQQFLTDQVGEGIRHPISRLNGVSGLALLNPKVMRLTRIHDPLPTVAAPRNVRQRPAIHPHRPPGLP